MIHSREQAAPGPARHSMSRVLFLALTLSALLAASGCGPRMARHVGRGVLGAALVGAAVAGTAVAVAGTARHWHGERCGCHRRWHQGRWIYHHHGYWEYYDPHTAAWYRYY